MGEAKEECVDVVARLMVRTAAAGFMDLPSAMHGRWLLVVMQMSVYEADRIPRAHNAIIFSN